VDCTIVADLAVLVQEREPSKLLITTDPEYVERLLPEMQERWRGVLYITRSLRHHIEINRHGAGKSAALDSLSRRLGAARECTVACGDSFNDLDMLRWAALGVAVAEAPAEVRAAADLVLPRAELGSLFERLAAVP
jgi:hydroxymethylpyrimidine pyrophosphatase-like HAD family hydrolase